MRRFSAVIALALSVALAGAARPARPPRPTPTPTPTPLATAAPVHVVPSVIVYPFGTSSDVKAAAGAQAAQLFQQVILENRDMAVIAPPKSTARTNYLTAARKLNADYYVSGYMTALGDSVALVEQLVSTQSGTIVYSRTSNIASLPDALGEAQTIHDFIRQRESALNASIAQADSSSSATPTPVPNGAEANLGSLMGLTHRRAKATPSPILTAAQKPGKGVLVVRISGPLAGSDLTLGTNALFAALNARYNARLVNAAPPNVAQAANGICGTERNNTIATGTAAPASGKTGFLKKQQYAFTLQVYTCFGAILSTTNASANSLSQAINSAVEAYAKDHPANA